MQKSIQSCIFRVAGHGQPDKDESEKSQERVKVKSSGEVQNFPVRQDGEGERGQKDEEVAKRGRQAGHQRTKFC